MSEFGRDKQYWAERLKSAKTDIEQMLCLSKIEAFELNEEITQLRQVDADRTKEAELAKRAANELQQKNTELAAQLVEVNNNRTGVSPCARFCEALATKKMFDNLQRERDELAVKVQPFTMYEWCEIGESNWAQCDKDWFEYCQKSPEHDTRKRLISVAEIKAQAVELVFNHFKKKFNVFEKLTVRDVCWMLNQHLNQLRQQAKVGE